MQDKEIEKTSFKIALKNYKEARKAKKRIDEKIARSRRIYKKEKVKRKDTTRSTVVVREVMKTAEQISPQIINSFISAKRPVSVKNIYSKDTDTAAEKLLNAFMEQALSINELEKDIKVLLIEGTLWVKSFWNSQKIKIKTDYAEFESEEDYLNSNIMLDKIKKVGNKYIGWNIKEETIKDRPDYTSIRNEDIFPDNLAKRLEDCRFIAIKKKKTVDEIKNNKSYRKINWNKVLKKNWTNSSLEQQRNDDLNELGREISSDELTKLVDVIEYWGYANISSQDAIEPVLIEWVEGYDDNEAQLLKMIENPMPLKNIPIYNIQYEANPFSLWGDTLAERLEDVQNIKTGVIRGILDNLSQANFGTTFINSEAFSAVEYAKLLSGARYIKYRSKEQPFYQPQTGTLPTGLFGLTDMMSKEKEEISGINNYGPGKRTDANRTGTNSPTETSMQIRLDVLTSKLGELLSRIAKDWLTMIPAILDEEEVVELVGENFADNIFSMSDFAKKTVKVNVITNLARDVKLHNNMLLMQNMKELGRQLHPEAIRRIVSNQLELLDDIEGAELVREKIPETQDANSVLLQQQLETERLKQQKLQAEIDEIKVRRDSTALNAQTKASAEATMNVERRARADKNFAEAEHIKVKTAIQPIKEKIDIAQKMSKELPGINYKGEK